MNNYIIDPMFFYWAGVVDDLRIILAIIGCAAACIGAIILTVFINDFEEKKRKSVIRISIASIVIGVLIMIGSIFIPREDTLIRMQVAKFGTYDNAEKVLSVIDEKTDKLIEAIDGSDKEDE